MKLGTRIELDVTGRDLDYEPATVVGRTAEGLDVITDRGERIGGVTRYRPREVPKADPLMWTLLSVGLLVVYYVVFRDGTATAAWIAGLWTAIWLQHVLKPAVDATR